MTVLRRVLVATDFSNRAAWAEARAAMLCEDMHLPELEVVSVEPPTALGRVAFAKNNGVVCDSQAVAQLQNKLMPVCVELERDFPVRCKPAVKVGLPVAEIISRAAEVDADLLIAGSHGSSRVDDAPLGYHVERLVRMATRPVLIVRCRPTASYQHVLVVVDGADAPTRAARAAIQIAPRAHFTFLQVDGESGSEPVDQTMSPDVHHWSASAEQARAQLDRFIAKINRLPQSVLRVACPGPVSISVREYIDLYKPDLVVFTGNAYTRIEDLFRGAHANDLPISQYDSAVDVDCLTA